MDQGNGRIAGPQRQVDLKRGEQKCRTVPVDGFVPHPCHREWHEAVILGHLR